MTLHKQIQERLSEWRWEDEELRGQVNAHRKELLAIVKDAKGEGVPASAIARELGVSRQSLHQRTNGSGA